MKILLKIALPLGVLALGLAVRSWLLATGPAPAEGAQTAAPVVVEFAIARLGEHRVTVTARGALRAEREAALAAEVGGRVEWIAPGLAPGAGFAAGEELLRLDPTDAGHALAAARAEHARATAALAIEHAAAASALADWEAFGSGAATPLALREPQVALAVATLEAAGTGVARAETALARCVVRAPFAGRCVERFAVPGTVVAAGAPLARLQSDEGFEARVVLSQDDLRTLGLSAGAGFAPLAAVVDAGRDGEPTWSARLLRLEPRVDPRDRTIGAVLALDAVAAPPLAGLFVRARIRGPELTGVALLPRAARQADGRTWLVDDAERLRLADAELAAEVDDGLLLRGIPDGARVCVTPLPIAVAGMLVQSREAR